MADRRIILNAFRPNAPIETPATFAGRENLVKSIADTLQTSGSCPVIYGDRGIGKSSLALQMARIALGDVELLQDLDEPSLALGEESRLTPFYIACSDSLLTKDAVL